MRVQIGYLDETYGTVEDTPDGGIVYTGDESALHALMRTRIRKAEATGQSMAELVASLPHDMRAYHWAEIVPETETEEQMK